MGVNLPAHLVIVKNTQQYVNGAYQVCVIRLHFHIFNNSSAFGA